MHNIDKVADFSVEIDRTKQTLEYVLCLHAVDLLKEIKYEEYDVELALQYAEKNGLPWCNDVEYAKRFMSTNHNDLIIFGRQKVGKFIRHILEKIRVMSSTDFIPVPLDATLAQHIDRTFKNLDTPALREKLRLEQQWSLTPGLRARPSYQIVSELDLIEKQLRHAADEYHLKQKESNYCWTHRDLFTSRLLKTIDDILMLNELTDITFNLKFWYAVLSILLRTSYPRYLTWAPTNEYYKTVTHRHTWEVAPILAQVREYSALSPVSAIHVDLDLSAIPKFGNTQTTKLEPNSLVEKYLVLHSLKHKI